MKKLLGIMLAVIVAGLLVVWLVLSLFLGTAVKTGVEAVLPDIVGAPVTLDDASISLFSGKGRLRGFVLGNPEGFKTDSAFRFDEVRVDVDVASLLSDTIVIEEIYINAPKITYEQGIRSSNIGTIRKNIEKLAGPKEEGAEPEAEPKKAKPGKKVVINHFLIENGEVALSATLLRGEALTAPLPKIELHDIGKESDGKPLGEVVAELFNPLANAVEAAAAQAKKLIGEGVEAVREGAEDALKEGADAVGEKAKEALEEGKKGVTDAVEGLFDRGD